MIQKTFLTLMIFFLSSTSFAYTISTYKSGQTIDYQAPTHVFVIGYSGGLSDQFFRAAVGKAQRYKELDSRNQVIVIGPDRMDSKSKYLDDYSEYKRRLKQMNLKLVRFNEKWLTSHRLMPELTSFSQIKTLEFFSHSAAHKGIGLDSIDESSSLYKYKRFNGQVRGIKKLRHHFTDDAYVMLHGCNSGFFTAPELAKAWGVPVAGSFSGTNFQEIFRDENWYFNDKGRYPADIGRDSKNRFSYQDGHFNCRSGYCTRMRPEPYPYRGYWGKLNAGLSHYKFFCGAKKASLNCKKAMARSLFAQLGNLRVNSRSSMEDFRQAAKEHLCPDASRPKARTRCFSRLAQAEFDPSVSVHGMARGKVLRCDFEKCDLKLKCTDSAGSCKILRAAHNPQPKTMTQEYRAFLEGFEAL